MGLLLMACQVLPLEAITYRIFEERKKRFHINK